MPKRPRQHQLEEQSRVAFRVAIPHQWVFRDSVPDYGIDGMIEVFDEHNLSTGQLFLIQLKATDEPNLDRALVISLPRETYEYYQSLDLPVLIARYHAPANKFYVKWCHTFDPYYAKKGGKSIAFRLAPEDVWGDHTAEKLVSDLEGVRRIKSPELPLPILFTLILGEPEVHGVPSGQIASEIRKLGKRLPSVIEVGTDLERKSPFRIVISNDKTLIDLAGVKSFTLHTSKGYSPELALSKFPYDVLLAVALALDLAGHSSTAANFVPEYGANSSLIKHPQVAVLLAGCMARARRITEALQLSEAFFESKDLTFAAQQFWLVAFVQSESLTAAEREFFRSFTHVRIQRAEEANDPREAAIWHYNLGNHLRGSRQFRLGFHHYRKAAKYDPNYKKRKYFWYELAGVLFETGNYSTAAKFYARALSLGEEGLCRGLYADALMFAGKYRQAQEEFERYLASTKDPESEWQLKARSLPRIRDLTGIDEQVRQTRAANELVEQGIVTSDEEERRKLLEKVLRLDALCGLAWFNLGVLWSKTGERWYAFFSFLIAGLCQEDDVEAWCNTVALGISLEGQQFLVPYIIKTAYFFNGERLMEQFVKHAHSQPKGFPVSEFINIMSELLSSIPKARQPMEIRLLKEGSEYDVIAIQKHDSNDDEKR